MIEDAYGLEYVKVGIEVGLLRRGRVCCRLKDFGGEMIFLDEK